MVIQGGVDLKNVSRVLNRTLEYSEQRQDLSSEQIQQITTILEKSANLSGLQVEVGYFYNSWKE